MMMRKMKNQLNKILKLIIIFLFFTLAKSNAMEDVSELTDAINEAKEILIMFLRPKQSNQKLLMKQSKKLIKQPNMFKKL